MLFDHFNNFPTQTNKISIFRIPKNLTYTLTELQSKQLACRSTVREIKEALNQMDPSKAPGPGGINASVIQPMWHTMKNHVVDLFHNFYENSKIMGGMNSLFMVLIPKVREPKCPRDYNPFSLMNVSIKLIIKLMPNRMKWVIEDLVSDTQCTFIHKCQISDCILIVGEAYLALRLRKKRGNHLQSGL